MADRVSAVSDSGPAAQLLPEPLSRPPLPPKLQVEPSARCNLRCRMCMLPYRRDVPAGRSPHLAWDTFRRLVDQVPGLRELHLQGLGEPLLNPRFFDMVACGAERGARVSTNTNLTRVDEAAAEACLRAGLHTLHVSVDAASPRLYEHIRRGGDFARVEEALGVLKRVRERAGRGEYGDRTPFRLVLVAVLMRSNLEELPALAALAGAFGADELSVQSLIQEFSEEEAWEYPELHRFVAAEGLRAGDVAVAEGVYAEARRVAAEAGVLLRLPRLDFGRGPAPDAPQAASGARRCDWPWTGLYMTYAGDLLPCCAVGFPERFPLPGVWDAPLEEIWHGPEYRELRRRLSLGRPPAMCAGCAIYRGRF